MFYQVLGAPSSLTLKVKYWPSSDQILPKHWEVSLGLQGKARWSRVPEWHPDELDLVSSATWSLLFCIFVFLKKKLVFLKEKKKKGCFSKAVSVPSCSRYSWDLGFTSMTYMSLRNRISGQFGYPKTGKSFFYFNLIIFHLSLFSQHVIWLQEYLCWFLDDLLMRNTESPWGSEQSCLAVTWSRK